jgi:hypothetical protein
MPEMPQQVVDQFEAFGGQTVVITGGTSGIGLATARMVIDRGGTSFSWAGPQGMRDIASSFILVIRRAVPSARWRPATILFPARFGNETAHGG